MWAQPQLSLYKPCHRKDNLRYHQNRPMPCHAAVTAQNCHHSVALPCWHDGIHTALSCSYHYSNCKFSLGGSTTQHRLVEGEIPWQLFNLIFYKTYLSGRGCLWYIMWAGPPGMYRVLRSVALGSAVLREVAQRRLTKPPPPPQCPESGCYPSLPPPGPCHWSTMSDCPSITAWWACCPCNFLLIGNPAPLLPRQMLPSPAGTRAPVTLRFRSRILRS